MNLNAQSNTLRSGTKLECYQIKSVLGVGGFGITYKAKDLNLGCHVAIKEYFPASFAIRAANTCTVNSKSSNDDEVYNTGLQRFLDEARTLAQFKSRSIVHVNRFIEANGTAYIIMDYEEGVPLSRYLLKSKKLNEHELALVAVPILEGLATIHNNKYLHRDIKPSNIYLRKHGRPVLIDFGSARQSLDEHASAATGFVTHGYAPFEQYNTIDEQGPWTDLYGLGATLYRCIMGKAPTDALDRLASIQAHQPDPLTPLIIEKPENYSTEILSCVDWMLSFQIDARPQSVREIIHRFKTIRSKRPQTESPKNVLSQKDIDWDAEFISVIESELATYIGPLATVMIKQALQKSTSLDELYQSLSCHIDSPSHKEQFMQLFSVRASTTHHGSMTEKMPEDVTTPVENMKTDRANKLDSIFKNKTEALLAEIIGPLAGFLIDEAINTSSNENEVIRKLLKEIPSEADRKLFLTRMNNL